MPKVAICLSTVLLLFLGGCEDKQPLTIGFVGGLTGRVADLGIAGRDAVTMAIEEANRAGGIAGRKLILLSRDDQQGRETAQQAVRELLEAESVAIIGPMTSQMAVDVTSLADQAGRVLIGPTIKTNQLNGKNDYFFRVASSLDRDAEALAAYVTDKGLKRVALLYDLANRAYAESWADSFTASLEAAGGETTLTSYVSAEQTPFLPLARKVLAQRPEAVVLVANALDTALFCQQLYKLAGQVPIFTTAWAFTSEELIKQGGPAVENLCAYLDFNAASTSPTYLDFRHRFSERFGYAPAFAAVLAYDAANLLLKALRHNPDPDQLRQTLLGFGKIEGLQGPFQLDDHGDAARDQYMVSVRHGKFALVQ